MDKAKSHLIAVQCRIADLACAHNGGELEIGDEVMIPWGEVDAIIWSELRLIRLEASAERRRYPDFLQSLLGPEQTDP